MKCPSLQELPSPPAGKTGWPWTAESRRASADGDADGWPQISVVTPSYNQGEFLEATIRSVLLQAYRKLEYMVIDGGSDDGSIEIIAKYAQWISHWASEPDDGQYNAINKGFAAATGDVFAWLNSDDMYAMGGLLVAGEIFSTFGDSVHWITGLPVTWDEAGRLCRIDDLRVYVASLIRRGFYEGRSLGWIQQESTLWRRRLWEQGGGVDESHHYASDFKLWLSFAAEEKLFSVRRPIAGFRRHKGQKTSSFDTYFEDIDAILREEHLSGVVNRLMRNRRVKRVVARLAGGGGGRCIGFDPKALKWVIE